MFFQLPSIKTDTYSECVTYLSPNRISVLFSDLIVVVKHRATNLIK